MLVAYCGSGYYGLQIQSNPDLRTIEGDFHKALENSGGTYGAWDYNDVSMNVFLRSL